MVKIKTYIQFGTRDAFLWYPSSGTLKIKRMDSWELPKWSCVLIYHVIVKITAELLLIMRIPHLTYPLHTWWCIRPWCTALICLCLWLLSLPLPNCSSIPSLSLFVSTVIFQVVLVVQFYIFLQVVTSMPFDNSCFCPYVRHDISTSVCYIITSLAYVV